MKKNNSKKISIALLAAMLISIGFNAQAMDASSLPAPSIHSVKPSDIKKRKLSHLKRLLHEVKMEYLQKDMNIPKKIKLMHDEKLEREGKFNMSTNSLDEVRVVSTTERLFSQKQTKWLMGHELAHILIRSNNLINPHWYMDQVTHPMAECIIPSALACAGGLCAIRGKMVVGLMAITYAPIYAINIYKIKANKKRYVAGSPKRIIGSFYEPLGKLEEFECDVLASFILPKGGKLGVEVFERFLELWGNPDEKNHPRNSTRANYLKVIRWWQTHISQKKT